jgi:hypothetical protein
MNINDLKIPYWDTIREWIKHASGNLQQNYPGYNFDFGIAVNMLDREKFGAGILEHSGLSFDNNSVYFFVESGLHIGEFFGFARRAWKDTLYSELEALRWFVFESEAGTIVSHEGRDVSSLFKNYFDPHKDENGADCYIKRDEVNFCWLHMPSGIFPTRLPDGSLRFAVPQFNITDEAHPFVLSHGKLITDKLPSGASVKEWIIREWTRLQIQRRIEYEENKKAEKSFLPFGIHQRWDKS